MKKTLILPLGFVFFLTLAFSWADLLHSEQQQDCRGLAHDFSRSGTEMSYGSLQALDQCLEAEMTFVRTQMWNDTKWRGYTPIEKGKAGLHLFQTPYKEEENASGMNSFCTGLAKAYAVQDSNLDLDSLGLLQGCVREALTRKIHGLQS